MSDNGNQVQVMSKPDASIEYGSREEVAALAVLEINASRGYTPARKPVGLLRAAVAKARGEEGGEQERKEE